MAKREPPLKIPLDFEETVRALLGTKPPPVGTPGSRKVDRPKKRGRKRKAKRG